MAAILLLLAAAVPDQEVEHLVFGVLGPSALEGCRGQYVIAATVVGEPPQERAVQPMLATSRSRLTRGCLVMTAPLKATRTQVIAPADLLAREPG